MRIGAVFILSYGLACATTFDPPRELVSVRANYARVAASPASRGRKDLLDQAKKTIQESEAALGVSWDYVVIDKTYVAERTLELIETKAATEEAVRRVNDLSRELADLENNKTGRP
jgi:hypothetical protein